MAVHRNQRMRVRYAKQQSINSKRSGSRRAFPPWPAIIPIILSVTRQCRAGSLLEFTIRPLCWPIRSTRPDAYKAVCALLCRSLYLSPFLCTTSLLEFAVCFSDWNKLLWLPLSGYPLCRKESFILFIALHVSASVL